MIDPSDIAGVTGSALIVTTYALSQAGRMDVRRAVYPALNALGAALVIVSLLFKFNLAAMIVEGFWCAISLAGLVGSLRRRGAASASASGEVPEAAPAATDSAPAEADVSTTASTEGRSTPR